MSQVWDDIDQRYVEVDDEPQDWTPDSGGVHFPTHTNDGITYTANPYDPPVTGGPGPTGPPTPPPGPDPGPPTPTPIGGGGGYGTPANFNVSSSWPQFRPPPLPNLPTFQKPPDFSYDPFSAPTLEQAQAEPGYEHARSESFRGLENSAAAKGLARTGGTIKDFIGWGNRLAEQNYGNVYNRAANTYGINRNNAAENFRTNFGVSRDVFDREYGKGLDLYDRSFNAELAKFNPQFTAAQLTFGDIYNRDRDKLNSLTNIATAGAGA